MAVDIFILIPAICIGWMKKRTLVQIAALCGKDDWQVEKWQKGGDAILCYSREGRGFAEERMEEMVCHYDVLK